ncbi:MAG: tripartite tricarboxylate transporter permease [Synergistaceae bacterium]|jgi:putative tricarboxylic transport membrane protein|uniref:tripartite tricarboxylate transporter permease n=1 Tax=Aminivibrio sp. TaxID=1872489 RepID=UPI001D44DB00|nr:tripartite tricarboxylate transporter permease [Synergistaceae bacterium]MDD3689433.1 tripartite tricarboxylate transporter permease [Synergistaceae bacterium]MDD4021441.1 tripartite tricarboxylate transporter permease [Synergistaceae bacterium]MDD4612236.1 tripartite tricarboxylate transporter permease [Synergistaceae bacterium]NCC56747.1 transporter [Synergistales bacterium]
MEILHLLADEAAQVGSSLISSLNPTIIGLIFGGSLLGMLVGAIPGLTATMALALLINLSYGMQLENAVAFLLAVYIGAVSGGLNAAIMINIPGTPSAAATCLDGFPLAKQGKGGLAMGTGVIASFVGTIFSIAVMIFLSPLIYKIALKFGHWELFLLALFGIMICGTLSAGKDPLKGWIVGFLGFGAAMVGMEQIFAYPRLTFGYLQLKGGIPLIPALIGVFGVSEFLAVLQEEVAYKIEGKVGKVIPPMREFIPLIPSAIRSGIIGVVIGAIPGAGEDIGSWLSYDVGKRRSKKGHLFGTGSYEGLVCSEVANNAVIGGAMIPLLTLAVPGSPPSAMFLAAVWLHGVRPGPMLNFENPGFLPLVAAMLILGSIAMLIWGLSLAKPMVAVLKIKREILLPIVIPLTVIGAYAGGVRIFDVYLMLAFGVLGYVLRQMDYPLAPLVLGLILGPLADTSFRRALQQSRGAIMPLLERPIGLILIACVVWLIWTGAKRTKQYYAEKAIADAAEDAAAAAADLK